MPHVGINAHLLSGSDGYRRAGIHVYIANSLRHLPPQRDWRYTVYANFAEDLGGKEILGSRFPTERRLFRIGWEQTILPWRAARAGLDLLHSAAFVAPIWRPCPVVATIYDLSFIVAPERFPAPQRHYLTAQTRYSCRHAARLIAISEAGRHDIHRLFGVPLDRIDLVYPGVSPAFCPLPAAQVTAFLQKKGVEPPYILHVGTLQPRKNIPMLIESFAQLRKQPKMGELKLVLVGGKGWLYDEIFERVTELGLSEQVIFTGYVPDEELPFWYNGASAFVFPSMYEGFGMPVVEAMACGVPVVAADSSAIPEAVGDAALVFPPGDAPTLTQRLTYLMQNREVVAELRQRGLAQAQKFSWENAGKRLQSVYQKALS